jgi:Polyketide cyclase / dehydrase and lipid transport
MADEAHEQIHVDAAPARCFACASAFEDYPAWTNDVKQATVLERDDEGRGTRVEYRAAALGRTVRYVLDYDFTDAPRGFSWSLVEGDMLRALDGEYGFTGDGDGTRVDYHLRVDLSIPLPGLVKRRASGLIMGTALRDLKRVVEER